MDEGGLIAFIVVGIIVTALVAGIVLVAMSITHFNEPIYTYEGELVNVETSAGGFGEPSKTTLYFEDGTVFVARLIDEILVLHENYRLEYYKHGQFVSFKLVSIEMIQNA